LLPLLLSEAFAAGVLHISSARFAAQMHYPPDLSLASSYIPACLCILKCSLAFILFIFSPIRGWIGLCCLLIVDRILWNQHGAILDANAVAVALVGGLMVMHTRTDGVHTVVHLAVAMVWALSSALQIMGLTRVQRSYEVLLGACAVTVMSCLYQAPERAEFLALRAFVFVVANTTLPYVAVMMQQYDIDTYVNACRTLLILLCELEVACAWVVAYMLCIGYQIRSGPAALKQKVDHASETPSVVVVHKTPSPPPPPTADAAAGSDEAALLREALASRRGAR
jgi:hypothetical protein